MIIDARKINNKLDIVQEIEEEQLVTVQSLSDKKVNKRESINNFMASQTGSNHIFVNESDFNLSNNVDDDSQDISDFKISSKNQIQKNQMGNSNPIKSLNTQNNQELIKNGHNSLKQISLQEIQQDIQNKNKNQLELNNQQQQHLYNIMIQSFQKIEKEAQELKESDIFNDIKKKWNPENILEKYDWFCLNNNSYFKNKKINNKSKEQIKYIQQQLSKKVNNLKMELEQEQEQEKQDLIKKSHLKSDQQHKEINNIQDLSNQINHNLQQFKEKYGIDLEILDIAINLEQQGKQLDNEQYICLEKFQKLKGEQKQEVIQQIQMQNHLKNQIQNQNQIESNKQNKQQDDNNVYNDDFNSNNKDLEFLPQSPIKTSSEDQIQRQQYYNQDFNLQDEDEVQEGVINKQIVHSNSQQLQIQMYQQQQEIEKQKNKLRLEQFEQDPTVQQLYTPQQQELIRKQIQSLDDIFISQSIHNNPEYIQQITEKMKKASEEKEKQIKLQQRQFLLQNQMNQKNQNQNSQERKSASSSQHKNSKIFKYSREQLEEVEEEELDEEDQILFKMRKEELEKQQKNRYLRFSKNQNNQNQDNVEYNKIDNKNNNDINQIQELENNQKNIEFYQNNKNQQQNKNTYNKNLKDQNQRNYSKDLIHNQEKEQKSPEQLKQEVYQQTQLMKQLLIQNSGSPNKFNSNNNNDNENKINDNNINNINNNMNQLQQNKSQLQQQLENNQNQLQNQNNQEIQYNQLHNLSEIMKKMKGTNFDQQQYQQQNDYNVNRMERLIQEANQFQQPPNYYQEQQYYNQNQRDLEGEQGSEQIEFYENNNNISNQDLLKNFQIQNKNQNQTQKQINFNQQNNQQNYNKMQNGYEQQKNNQQNQQQIKNNQNFKNQNNQQQQQVQEDQQFNYQTAQKPKGQQKPSSSHKVHISLDKFKKTGKKNEKENNQNQQQSNQQKLKNESQNQQIKNEQNLDNQNFMDELKFNSSNIISNRQQNLNLQQDFSQNFLNSQLKISPKNGSEMFSNNTTSIQQIQYLQQNLQQNFQDSNNQSYNQDIENKNQSSETDRKYQNAKQSYTKMHQKQIKLKNQQKQKELEEKVKIQEQQIKNQQKSLAQQNQQKNSQQKMKNNINQIQNQNKNNDQFLQNNSKQNNFNSYNNHNNYNNINNDNFQQKNQNNNYTYNSNNPLTSASSLYNSMILRKNQEFIPKEQQQILLQKNKSAQDNEERVKSNKKYLMQQTPLYKTQSSQKIPQNEQNYMINNKNNDEILNQYYNYNSNQNGNGDSEFNSLRSSSFLGTKNSPQSQNQNGIIFNSQKKIINTQKYLQNSVQKQNFNSQNTSQISSVNRTNSKQKQGLVDNSYYYNLKDENQIKQEINEKKDFCWLDYNQQERAELWVKYKQQHKKQLKNEQDAYQTQACPFSPELVSKQNNSMSKIMKEPGIQLSKDFHKKVKNLQNYADIQNLKQEIGFSSSPSRQMLNFSHCCGPNDNLSNNRENQKISYSSIKKQSFNNTNTNNNSNKDKDNNVNYNNLSVSSQSISSSRKSSSQVQSAKNSQKQIFSAKKIQNQKNRPSQSNRLIKNTALGTGLINNANSNLFNKQQLNQQNNLNNNNKKGMSKFFK
ncbi:hypothetical protein PPERSA_05800 [Pseudocohnilembus persalinus]|uniref:Uncharacterized protein n=1 Tax=Pseudocohnilembus persalinus TaxID=266149 RepID=A0A0V0QZN0_PSEPJ|nr:hypothetical protein PPERSA_05800 [Pseudocohnilembus persalinus]|eukprot:KRX07737.1 hypothetical protein PPERSA_05800 [Pseudocohnilembus persalinus]